MTLKILRTANLKEVFASVVCLCAFRLCTSHHFTFSMHLLGAGERFETLQRLGHGRRAILSSGAMSGPCGVCPEAGLTVSYRTPYGEGRALWIECMGFGIKI